MGHNSILYYIVGEKGVSGSCGGKCRLSETSVAEAVVVSDGGECSLGDLCCRKIRNRLCLVVVVSMAFV